MVLDGIKRLFSKSGMGKEERAIARQTVLHGAVTGNRERSLTEQQLLSDLGINLHMIKDDGAQQILTLLSYTDYQKVTDKDTGKESYVPTGVDLNMLGAKLKASPLIRASYVDDIDAEIGQLDAEIFVLRQILSTNEDEYEQGLYSVLSGTKDIILTAWADAKRGRKAKLLKARTSSLEVSMPDQRTLEKRGF